MQDYIERNLKVSWHPCTQMKDHELLPPLAVVRAQGVYLFDVDGSEYIDAISSWWTNIWGHCHPTLIDAISQQASILDHTLFAGVTHPPAIELAERLTALSGLDRCQFSPAGSSAVEIALKQSFQYWQNRGQSNKQKFISLQHSYHGETLGALAVSDVPLFTKTFQPLLIDHLKAPSPDYYASDMTPAEAAFAAIVNLESLFQQHHQTLCAFIIEPLVQCATGMRMYDESYLLAVRRLCDEFDIHLIVDEISTGFFRTGQMFASGNINPDFLCLGKGITGGTLPLAATLTTEKVYQEFYHDYASGKGFMHSHSYTANPICCSVALANLDIFAQDSAQQNIRQLIAEIENVFSPLIEHPQVANVRQCGSIWACEITPDGTQNTAWAIEDRKALWIYKLAREQGVLLRPIGSTIYIMPPYVTKKQHLEKIYQVILSAIDAV